MVGLGVVYTPGLMALYACNLATIADSGVCSDIACMCLAPEGFATLIGCTTSIFSGPLVSTVDAVCGEYSQHTQEDIDAALAYYYQQALQLDPITVENYHSSYKNYLGNYNHSVQWGKSLLGYWLAVMILYLLPIKWRYHFPLSHEIVLSKRVWALPPTMAEIFFLMGYIILSLIFTVAGYEYISTDKLFALPTQAILKYVADRTGILATFVMPLMVAFAGRNNPLQSICRCSYASFLSYHRWIARVVVAQIAVHSIAYCLYYGVSSKNKKGYMIAGVVGSLSFLGLIVQAVLPLRRRWYEVFLALHVCLSMIGFIALWFHLRDFGYEGFMYVAIGVWVVDRLGRLLRTRRVRAQITVLGDTVKIEIPIHGTFRAGGHVFLHFHQNYLQSHPFTYVPEKGRITVYAKIKEGITSQLVTESAIVLVDGPYGEAAPTSPTTVYIAGGHGIPGIYSEAKAADAKLIWITRSHKWFNPNHTIKIFDTSFGRPDLDTLIATEVAAGTTDFVACGHPEMMVKLLSIVARHHAKFHNQLQQWA